MKIIEMRLREIGFVLWGHCQNLLDDPRTQRAILSLWGIKSGTGVIRTVYLRNFIVIRCSLRQVV